MSSRESGTIRGVSARLGLGVIVGALLMLAQGTSGSGMPALASSMNPASAATGHPQDFRAHPSCPTAEYEDDPFSCQAACYSNEGGEYLLAADPVVNYDGISTQSDPSWGRVAAPSMGSAYYKLDYATGAVSRLTQSGYVFNDGQNGVYVYNGPSNRPISYSVTFGPFTGNGVTVVSTVVNGYVDAPGSGVTNGAGAFTLKVGGTLAVSHDASVEPHAATITITVNYQ